MKTETSVSSTFSNALLTGTILLANIDVNGLLDYGLKAFVGGAVWLGFKFAADYMEKRNKKNNHHEPHQ